MNAKGRNGWIKVAGTSAWHSRHADSVFLELWSRRQGSSPPIQIFGTPDEMKRLAEALLAAVAEAEAVPPCTCAPGQVVGAGHSDDCPHSRVYRAPEPAPC